MDGKTVGLPDAGTLAVTDAMAADMLSVTVDFVQEQIRSQKLAASFIGGRILIRPESIVAFLKNSESFETAKKHLQDQKQ